jgi:CMP-N-acetylneuraminic acid synthetase
MLETVLTGCQHQYQLEMSNSKNDRKNSLMTEPGSPLRKKKKIKKTATDF